MTTDTDENRRMTLVERLRNPQWESLPGECPRLNVEQTREVMDEAANVLSLVWAVVGDVARHRRSGA